MWDRTEGRVGLRLLFPVATNHHKVSLFRMIGVKPSPAAAFLFFFATRLPRRRGGQTPPLLDSARTPRVSGQAALPAGSHFLPFFFFLNRGRAGLGWAGRVPVPLVLFFKAGWGRDGESLE